MSLFDAFKQALDSMDEAQVQGRHFEPGSPEPEPEDPNDPEPEPEEPDDPEPEPEEPNVEGQINAMMERFEALEKKLDKALTMGTSSLQEPVRPEPQKPRKFDFSRDGKF